MFHDFFRSEPRPDSTVVIRRADERLHAECEEEARLTFSDYSADGDLAISRFKTDISRVCRLPVEEIGVVLLDKGWFVKDLSSKSPDGPKLYICPGTLCMYEVTTTNMDLRINDVTSVMTNTSSFFA